MRKLLNTLYITNEKAFLCLDGENIVCKIEDENKFRIPFENVEGIVCFSYLGCSPALMGKCVEKCIPINFVSSNGKFLAKVVGETKGNVFLRIAQIDKFREYGVKLTQNTMASKFCNTTKLIKRTLQLFLQHRYKIYFCRYHFCIFLKGLQIFFIYKRFPSQS